MIRHQKPRLRLGRPPRTLCHLSFLWCAGGLTCQAAALLLAACKGTAGGPLGEVGDRKVWQCIAVMARLAQAPADSASMRGERRYDGKARKAEQDQQAQTKASCVLHCRALGSRAVAASRPQVLFPCQPSPASALNMALNVLAPEWCPSPPTAPFRLSPTAKVWTQVPLSPTIRSLWTAPAKQAAPAKPRSNTTMVETVAGLKSMLEVRIALVCTHSLSSTQSHRYLAG